MTTPALTYFTALVRFETELWNIVERRLAGAPLTLGRLTVLQVVRATEACRVQDVAVSVGTTVGAASRLVDRLESDGLIAREPNPRDRRSSIIVMSEAGTAAVVETEPLVERAVAEALAAIEPTALAATAATLTEHHRAVRSRA